MKAENLNVGDQVYLPGINSRTFRIEAILPSLLYPNYLEFHVELLKESVYVPADRQLTYIGTVPVLL